MSEDDVGRSKGFGLSPTGPSGLDASQSVDPTSVGAAKASAQSQKATSKGRAKCILSV
jgi:hypothetical protein